MNRTGLILASIISLCVAGNVEARNAHLKAGRGGVERGNPGEPEHIIVDPRTAADRRLVQKRVERMFPSSDCSSWNGDRRVVTAVMNLYGQKELWIGTKYSGPEGLGIDGIEKRYGIAAFSKGGSPLQGNISIRLPSQEMNVEKECFNKLKGAEVRGANNYEQGFFQGDLWKMTIKEIKYGVLVDAQGAWKKEEATDESQVTLSMSEGLASMALRKSLEHLWAIPGSLALMILWPMGGRILRRMRTKRQAWSKTGPMTGQPEQERDVHEGKNFGLKDAAAVKETPRESRRRKRHPRQRRAGKRTSGRR